MVNFYVFWDHQVAVKTTLLRAIAGLDIQTSGSVFQDGKDVSNLPASERDFGIVFQSYALFPNLTVKQNIAFGLENAGKNKAATAQRVTELLTLVDLMDQGDKYPAMLSGWATTTYCIGPRDCDVTRPIAIG